MLTGFSKRDAGSNDIALLRRISNRNEQQRQLEGEGGPDYSFVDLMVFCTTGLNHIHALSLNSPLHTKSLVFLFAGAPASDHQAI